MDEFVDFQIVEKQKENDSVVSLLLRPEKGQRLPSYIAGQYIVLKVQMNDQTLQRCYSISNTPELDNLGIYRVTVKREQRMNEQGPSYGIVSNWLHSEAQVGMSVAISRPKGKFCIQSDSNRPIVFVGAGVGVTPLLPMLYQALKAKRPVWLIYACLDGASHLFQDEVKQLAKDASGRFKTHIIYRKPRPQDRQENQFNSELKIDRALIQTLLPLDDYEVYICGPQILMTDIKNLFNELGVSSEQIFSESFGAQQVENSIRQHHHELAHKVYFRESGKETTWNQQANTLLELAEQIGINAEHSCRVGGCGACECELLQGSIEYIDEPTGFINEGKVLPCCARPKSDVVLGI
ncbi:2Fe-2S iron-sulfur cluster-binding protein [Algicola sagamiensis]|uniref:2Fe-2S iron-sulfur cluster-binding protein n=1 Tax=Algicola sagamiensis TaxID=163869 RepID=UPI000360111F|nr:2Fe-2S iron-sulfur cluster-binding protein [Algicola sagamiensis]